MSSNERIFEGSVLEEALRAASSTLGIAEPDLDYEIIEQGRRGLFGIGAKSVRIRIMPPLHEASPAPEPSAPEPRAPRPRSRNRRARPVDAPAEQAASAAPATEEDAGRLEATAQRMLELLGFDVRATGTTEEATVRLQLDGSELEMLSGKDGEVLSALQFLLNRMGRRSWPSVSRVVLADGARREVRDEELIRRTHEVAREVSRTSKARRLPEMNAYERRLVHLAVREYTDLGSRSEGNGKLKRVRIYKQRGGGNRK